MIQLVFAFTGLMIIIVLAWAHLPNKVHAFLIPVLFLLGFLTIKVSIDYSGYAVDGSYIPDGTEAVVLSQSQADPYIYFTLMFKGSKEPRLVKMLASEENKKESKKNNTDQPMVIHFGKKFQGNGGNSKENSGDSEFQMVPYGDSNIGKKNEEN